MSDSNEPLFATRPLSRLYISYIYKSLLMAVKNCVIHLVPRHISVCWVWAPPRNELIAIMKVKITTSYKACKCDCSIAVRACGVAISQEVVTLAYMRELYIKMEHWKGARSYILKWCQELHFNYCIQYSLQIWRACRYGGAPYWNVVRSTERQPHIQIWAPFPLQYGASIFVTEVQPNDP